MLLHSSMSFSIIDDYDLENNKPPCQVILPLSRTESEYQTIFIHGDHMKVAYIQGRL